MGRVGLIESGDVGSSDPRATGVLHVPPSMHIGGGFFMQLALPGVELPPLELVSLAQAQREFIEAWERYQDLRARVLRGDHSNPVELPLFLRRQAE
jgi:hypothetical protein